VKQSPKHIAEQESKEAREAKKDARTKLLENMTEKNLSKFQDQDLNGSS